MTVSVMDEIEKWNTDNDVFSKGDTFHIEGIEFVGKHFVVMDQCEEEVKCIDTNRNNWDIECHDDEMLISEEDGLLFAVVDYDDVHITGKFGVEN